MLVSVVALCPLALFAEASQRAKGTDGFENAGPHGVEVDGRRHDRNNHLVGSQFRQIHLTNVDALARVLFIAGDPFPHGLVFLSHIRSTVCSGNREGSDFLARCPIENCLKDFFHAIDDSEFWGFIS